MTTPVGEGAQSGAAGTQSGAGDVTGTGSGTTTEPNTTAQSGGENQQPQTTDTVSRADLDAVIARMKAADTRAGKAEQELKQLRDKDLPEAEKLQRDYQAAQEQVQKLQATNQQLALQVAFLKDNTFTWHNPESALKLVDLSQVTIEEDGSVRGLKDALKALATSNDYLVKKEATQEAPKPSGTAPANNGGSTGAKPSGKGMVARIPALQTRVKQS
jgi:hypothetical protein